MDFDWDDGLVITNNGPTIYDFALKCKSTIEGEPDHFSAGIIETGMTTSALDIPLVEGENDFAIFVREDPSFTFYGSIYELPERHSGVTKSPSGFKYAANQVLIKFKENTPDEERHKVAREHNLFFVGYTSNLETHVGRIDDGRDPHDVAVRLCNVKSIDYAEVNAIGEVCSYYIPDDPAWNDPNKFWAMERVQATKAWGLYDGGWVDDIVLCVADSGIYHTIVNGDYILHEDFELGSGRINTFKTYSKNFVNDRNDDEFHDNLGHGTNVAGIAMATGDNDTGLAGMVWNPHLVALRCYPDDFEHPYDQEPTAYDTAMSIRYIGDKAVLDPNIRIIGIYALAFSEEWAPYGVDHIKDAVAYTYGKADNVLLVASAGNINDNEYFYPASCSGVISVSGSQGGQEEGLDLPNSVTYNDLVDVCAPSTIESVFTTGFPGQDPYGYQPVSDPPFNNWYGYFGGTSASAPFVAGLAALIWDKHPDWCRERITNVIKKAADPMFFGKYPGEDHREGLMGTGRINAYCALATCPCELNDWAEHGGGSYWDVGRAITTLSDDSVVVTGSFQDVASFGNVNLTSDGDKDIFLARYNSDGSLIGALRAGGEDEVQAYGIKALPDDSVMVTGSFEGTATIGGTQLISAGGRDIFLARYSAAGQPLGGIRAGGDYDIIAYGITSFPVPVMPPSPEADYVVITGEFTGTAIFGEGQPNETELESAGASDIFLACYDPYNGTLQWAVSECRWHRC